jgi:hypothetical protein
MNECQVPLVELLKSVPNDARFVQEEEFSSAYYPVGTLCHQAADRIAELEKRHTTLQTQFDNLYELANSGDEMNTEPVAWLVQYPDRHEFRWKKPEHLYEAIGCEPLYTHPNEHDLGIAEAVGFDRGYQAATARSQESDCYGDGTVYRRVRSKDSEVKTYVFDEHAGKQTWSIPAKTPTDDFINKNHMGYVSPAGAFYAPDYPTWKQDGLTPVYREPTVEELTDEDLEIITEALLMVGFTDAFINYELKEKALAILRKAQEK